MILQLRYQRNVPLHSRLGECGTKRLRDGPYIENSASVYAAGSQDAERTRDVCGTSPEARHRRAPSSSGQPIDHRYDAALTKEQEQHDCTEDRLDSSEPGQRLFPAFDTYRLVHRKRRCDVFLVRHDLCVPSVK